MDFAMSSRIALRNGTFTKYLVMLFTLLFAQGSLAANLSGIVYGDGTPLEGATVTLFDAGQVPIDSVATTIDGGYLFSTLSNGNYYLSVTPPSGTPFTASPLESIAIEGNDVQHIFTLISSARTLFGYLRDAQGRPIDHVSIHILDQQTNQDAAELAWTDANGFFQATVAPGVYKFRPSVEPWGHWDEATSSQLVPTYPLPDLSMIFYLGENTAVSGDTQVNLTMPLAVLSGKTVDSNGVPVPGVQLRASHQHFTAIQQYDLFNYGNRVGGSQSDENGSFQFSIYVNQDTDFLLHPPTDRPDLATTKITAFNISSDTVTNFTVDNSRTLSGYLRDAQGRPIDHVSIHILDQQTNQDAAELAWTDANGFFQATVAPGVYKFRPSVEPWGHWDEATSSQLVPTYPLPDLSMIFYLGENTAVSGDTQVNLTMPLAVLSGKTVDSNGVPVPGVQLRASHQHFTAIQQYDLFNYGNRVGGSQSDENGSFQFSIYVNQDTDFLLHPPTDRPDLATTKITAFNISSDTVTNFTVDNSRTLSGYLRDAQGRPIDHVSIHILDQQTNQDAAELAWTDANGFFQATVAPGVYKFRPSVEPWGHWDEATSSQLVPTYPLPDLSMIFYLGENTAVSGDTQVNLTMPLAVLSGKTVDSNGVPVPGVQLRASHQHFTAIQQYDLFNYGNRVGGSQSDENGSFQFSIYVNQDTTLRITPDSQSGFGITNVLHNIVTDVTETIVLTLSDTTSPLILSGPSVRDITDTSAIIEWETDEASDSVVTVGGSTVTDTTLVTHHEVAVGNLAADTEYLVTVASTDAQGNGPTTGTTTFRTLVTPDLQSPLFVDGPVVTDITHNSALVRFETNEPVTAVVTLYQGGSPVAQVNTALDHSHQVPLSGLTPETAYEVIVVITDAAGNGPTVSAPLAFTTLALPDTDAPLILTGPHISEITATGATVTWTTNEPANSGVSYNDGTAYGVITGEALVTEHQVTLADLAPQTTYYVTVSSTDALGNGPTLSQPVSFTTLAIGDTDPPRFIGVPLVHEVNHQMALIKWQTDERSDSVVLFGTNPAELIYEAAKSNLTTQHSVPVNHLDAATRYYFLVHSTDADGNTAQSDTGSFITRSNDPHDGVEFAVPPDIIGSTDTTLTAYWRTHQNADSLLQCTDTLGTTTQVADGKRKKEHQLTLTNLLSGETYACCGHVGRQQGQQRPYGRR